MVTMRQELAEPEWEAAGLRLDAESLWSKSGFNDGDEPELLIDLMNANGVPWDQCRGWHGLLAGFVREYLLPLLPGVEVYEIGTIHNPIRATDQEYDRDNTPERFRDVHVVIPWDTVLAAIKAAAASG